MRYIWLPSAAAYLICVIFTLFGKPPVSNIDVKLQLPAYLCLGLIMTYRNYVKDNKELNIIISIFYGAAAMLAYMGVVDWVSYNGSTVQGPAMALWDLVIAHSAQDPT
jgi:hypothetical protein